jgi:hypothetical protein
MLLFEERIQLLEKDLMTTPPGFVMNKDLPFSLFRYDPNLSNEEEWKVRREIRNLAVRIENKTGKKVHNISLADLFWKGIQESEGVDLLFDLERIRGFEATQSQVSTYLSSPEWRPMTDLLSEAISGLESNKDIAFLVHASVFAPNAYRISALLEQMMGRTNVPAVLFYPGSWVGTLNYMGLRSEEQPLGSYRVKIYGRE